MHGLYEAAYRGSNAPPWSQFLRRVLLNLITWGAAKNALRLALPRA